MDHIHPGNSLEFKVDNNLAFEIPLSNVTNAFTAKNEVTIEFHQNDDASVSLMEVRFHIPPDPDPETDAVIVSVVLCLVSGLGV